MHVFASSQDAAKIAKKIEKLKQQRKISTYELALDMGLSEYPIQTLLAHNKATVKTINTINYYLTKSKLSLELTIKKPSRL